MESAQRIRQAAANRAMAYYIQNSSFHRNRLVGATARTAKSFLFENNDGDFYYDNCNTSTHPIHGVQLGILAEYSWNTQAPGNQFLSQSDGVMSVNGIPWGEWERTNDLDGPVGEILVPRTCRLYFGPEVGDALALAYAAGGTYNMDALGGPATVPPDRRARNSATVAEQLSRASVALSTLWGRPNVFNARSYGTYQSVFKYAFVFQHLERIHSCLMQLSWIAETGKDAEKVDGIAKECRTWIGTAREDIRGGYDRYDLAKVPFAAIYSASLGDLKDVYGKIDRLEDDLECKMKQIETFGAGNMAAMLTTVGIPPGERPVIIDGKLDEWDMTIADILDHSYYNRKVGTQGISGTKDVIAYWAPAWDSAGLTIAVQIFDDNLSFASGVLYQNDAIELWIDKDQFVFSLDRDGIPAVESYGSYNKAKIQYAARVGDKPDPLHPDMKYWTAEIKVPIECLKTSAAVGNGFHMAIGVDDVDSGEKASQLFFPETYRHLAMTVGATAEKNFARALFQKKADIGVALVAGKVHDDAKADGMHTCIDVQFSLKTTEKVSGVSGELRIWGKDGIHRRAVIAPVVLEGEWKNAAPERVDTGEYFEPTCGIDLIVRAPGFQKSVTIRDGKARSGSLGYVLRSASGRSGFAAPPRE